MFANANFEDKNELSIEPRLLEYLDKKKMYKNNKYQTENLEKY